MFCADGICWKIIFIRSLTTTTTTLFVNWTHFAHIVHDCLNVNFPGRWIGRGGPIAWPPRSPDLTPLNFSLRGYVKDQVCSQRVYTPDELKAWITAAIVNVTKGMLQRIWQEVDYRWEVCRATDRAHCEVFRT
jgi:hypothetical protein